MSGYIFLKIDMIILRVFPDLHLSIKVKDGKDK